MTDPESFSPESARLAIEEIFDALPKTRRMDHIGAFNEALVTLSRLSVGRDKNKEVRS